MQLILAAANQFAERAELGIPLPIQPADVTEVRGRAEVHRTLVFTVSGRHRFSWFMTENLRGRINYDDLKYSTPRIDLQTFLPSLTNVPSLITTNEALKIAERCLHRLGYDRLKQFRLPPLVAQFTHQNGPDDVPKPVPLYGIRWLPVKEDGWEPYVFEIEVSGITKRVTRFGQLTLEGAIIDLRSFMTNSQTKARAPATNAGRAARAIQTPPSKRTIGTNH